MSDLTTPKVSVDRTINPAQGSAPAQRPDVPFEVEDRMAHGSNALHGDTGIMTKKSGHGGQEPEQQEASGRQQSSGQETARASVCSRILDGLRGGSHVQGGNAPSGAVSSERNHNAPKPSQGMGFGKP